MLVHAFTIAFGCVAAAGPAVIARLRALALRQTAYEDAPASHQRKTGTPTMGGVLFLFAPLVALVLQHDAVVALLSFLMIGCGVVGYVDDFAAIKRGRNRGLSPREKFGATIAVAAVFLGIAFGLRLLPVQGFVFPAIAAPVWLIAALAFCAILATTHAVNLTDGLDGLAGGSIVPTLLVAAWLGLKSGSPGVAVFDAALLGAVGGFLLYNRHPAKVFMGDTGALALGAALAGSAILSGATLLLPLMGAVFAAEALSVIIQVTSFKTTGRRIFRMSPLHHHFELGGLSETRVTGGFWLASSVCAVMTAVVGAR